MNVRKLKPPPPATSIPPSSGRHTNPLLCVHSSALAHQSLPQIQHLFKMVTRQRFDFAALRRTGHLNSRK
jgi:hypothetical protein